MNKKRSVKFKILIMLVAAMFVVGTNQYGFANAPDSTGNVINTVADQVTPTPGDIYQINRLTPGAFKTSLGDRLQGVFTVGATTLSANATGNYNVTTAVATTPTTTAFLVTTGSTRGESYLLGNGYVGQELTAVLVTDGNKDFIITPKTKTGFTDVHLDDAKDSVTLKFVDDTTGWVIKGNAGATIN